MKIAVVSGSHRKGESQKVMEFLADRLESRFSVEAMGIDLYAEDIPFWEESYWQLGEDWNENWSYTSEKLSRCDGVILISPEYGGMATPLLKNFMLLCSNGEIAHKPALIVSISSGISGAYPVSELRSSSYKNTKVCYIPENLIIRNVEEFNKAPESEECSYTSKRIMYSLSILVEYTRVFVSLRKCESIANPEFKFGM